MNSGFLIIDKPPGMSSHDVVNRVRRITGIKKTGHTGTLDPFATGVLPVAINNGTKVIQFLDEGIKVYKALVVLGVATDTLDLTGNIIEEKESGDITLEKIKSCITGFLGDIIQIPPMFSAIKQNGQPLYKLARKGVEVEREPRKATIYSIELLEYSNPMLSLMVSCSRGTYIRTLADDMGKALGCGAALKELRREQSGSFMIENSISLEKLDELCNRDGLSTAVIGIDKALAGLPDYQLSAVETKNILNGIPPKPDSACLGLTLADSAATLFKCMSGGEVIAVAEYNHKPEKTALKRVICQVT